MTSEDRLIRTATGGGLATITLDSPANRNALSRALLTQLRAALEEAAGDDAVRVVLLDHTGPVFCSGADLKETARALAAADGDRAADPPVGLLADVLAAVWECPKPVVAKVDGAARAGGLGLIAAADLAVCAQDATFAFSEVRVGVVPAVISATVLRRLTPRAAAELFLTGEVFDGRRAQRIGLVTAATPAGEVTATVARYCQALLAGGPVALAATKRLLLRRPATTLRDDLAELTELSARYFGSPEGVEGALAFRERRSPEWAPKE